MDFNTELGRSQRILVYDVKYPVTGAGVATSMDSIITKNIFPGLGGNFTGKLDARLVIKDSTELELIWPGDYATGRGRDFPLAGTSIK
ncbi:MAG: DUF2922 domain-containing protein [Syntrophomonadaceae bacterium]|nr:DUF2922 domain-containing protein [Syntrophomonadaceae bacterium]